MIKRRSLLISAPLLLLSGCQPAPLDVRISGDPAAPIIEVKSPGGLFGWIEAHTNKVLVSAPLDGFKLMWGIRASQCRSGDLRVRYGVVSEGFVEDAPPRTLSPDVEYQVTVGGCGGYTGDVYFEILGGRIIDTTSAPRWLPPLLPPG